MHPRLGTSFVGHLPNNCDFLPLWNPKAPFPNAATAATAATAASLPPLQANSAELPATGFKSSHNSQFSAKSFCRLHPLIQSSYQVLFRVSAHINIYFLLFQIGM
jgi:hypothetical protein